MTQITPSRTALVLEESELMQFFRTRMSNCAPSAVAQAGSWDTTDDVTKGPKKNSSFLCTRQQSSGVF